MKRTRDSNREIEKNKRYYQIGDDNVIRRFKACELVENRDAFEFAECAREYSHSLKEIEPETKCSLNGFQHAWQYVDKGPFLSTGAEKCLNCRLEREPKSYKYDWYEYNLPDAPIVIDTSNDDLTNKAKLGGAV
jgi:hypothetical protein